MSTPYTVQAGDWLQKIAEEHGFESWRDLYYHPDNAEFRRKRPDPNKIYPGDIIMETLKAKAGTQFDREVVTNFLRVYEKGGFSHREVMIPHAQGGHLEKPAPGPLRDLLADGRYGGV